jgi:hypothetical protein
MDHRDISNTGYNTDAFRVAEAATGDVPSCSGFWDWYVKRVLRKLATKVFDLSALILGLCLDGYLSSQKVRTAFFHICGKNVLSAV